MVLHQALKTMFQWMNNNLYIIKSSQMRAFIFQLIVFYTKILNNKKAAPGAASFIFEINSLLCRRITIYSVGSTVTPSVIDVWNAA